MRRGMRRTEVFALAAALLVGLNGFALAFKENEFKTCAKSSFCERLRSIVPDSKYAIRGDTLSVDDTGAVHGKISVVGGEALAPYHDDIDLTLEAYGAGALRVHMSQPGRFEVPEVLQDDLKRVPLALEKTTATEATFTFLDALVVVRLDALKIEVYGDKRRKGTPSVVFNANNLFHFERQIDAGKAQDAAKNWPETFLSHADSRKNGPMGLSVDVHFPKFQHVYGIPERATKFSLKPTKEIKGKGIENEVLHEPYRLYNLDVFEYLHDHPFGLYGSIPFLTAKRRDLTTGVFWLNAAEMYVDVWKTAEGTSTQWMAESGVIDLFFFLGPSPREVIRQYSTITGTTDLPPLFSLGYHQCRWNYKDEQDVAEVDRGMDRHGIPCDVIWLDIEHTDGKRYMTWDAQHFPTPQKMQESLAVKGRKMVAIVDPHIKKDDNWWLFKEAKQNGYFVKKPNGAEDFEGWCWPGASLYLDMLNPEIRKWWSGLFDLGKYKGSTESLFVWNDMNEPSVFNGPEITMHKDNLHFLEKKGTGVEHRDVHNIYGMLYHKATAEGLKMRKGERPFVLSRAFFSGTQRIGPIWTGDNTADWDHLRVSVPMLLSLGVSGLTFSGADVGGFFKNPDPELLVRWYQLGAFYPFFRAHAHIETKRREPWLFEDAARDQIKAAVVTRYTLLPYLYTLFKASEDTGAPILRPIFFEFEDEEDSFEEDAIFLFGDKILVAPVLEAGASQVAARLPGRSQGTWWYPMEEAKGRRLAGGKTHNLPVDLDAIPVMVRGGSIVPRRMRPRRTTAAMSNDPFTLLVCLDKSEGASGDLYLDDGKSVDLQDKYLRAELAFAGAKLSNNVVKNKLYYSNASTLVERVIIRGLKKQVTQVGSEMMKIKHFKSEKAADGTWTLTIMKPGLSMTENWTLMFK